MYDICILYIQRKYTFYLCLLNDNTVKAYAVLLPDTLNTYDTYSFTMFMNPQKHPQQTYMLI